MLEMLNFSSEDKSLFQFSLEQKLEHEDLHTFSNERYSFDKYQNPNWGIQFFEDQLVE